MVDNAQFWYLFADLILKSWFYTRHTKESFMDTWITNSFSKQRNYYFDSLMYTEHRQWHSLALSRSFQEAL